jgi:hypothetical protein
LLEAYIKGEARVLKVCRLTKKKAKEMNDNFLNDSFHRLQEEYLALSRQENDLDNFNHEKMKKISS